MTPTYDYDASAYRKAVRDLVDRFHVDSGALLRDEARLLVRDLMQLTPPKNGGGLSAGQRAAERDINRVFLPIRKALKLLRSTLGESKTTSLIARLLRKGKFEEAKRFLMPNKVWNLRVRVRAHSRNGSPVSEYHQRRTVKTGNIPGVDEATEMTTGATIDPAKHTSRRNRYGKVLGRRYSQILLDNRAGQALRKYIQEVKDRVGFALAGWLPAADRMGFRVADKWVARFRGKAPGNVIDASNMSGPRMSITLINRSSKMPDLQHVVNGAVKLRMRSFESDAARILAGGKTRRAPFRGTSAFGPRGT